MAPYLFVGCVTIRVTIRVLEVRAFLVVQGLSGGAFCSVPQLAQRAAYKKQKKSKYVNAFSWSPPSFLPNLNGLPLP